MPSHSRELCTFVKIPWDSATRPSESWSKLSERSFSSSGVASSSNRDLTWNVGKLRFSSLITATVGVPPDIDCAEVSTNSAHFQQASWSIYAQLVCRNRVLAAVADAGPDCGCAVEATMLRARRRGASRDSVMFSVVLRCVCCLLRKCFGEGSGCATRCRHEPLRFMVVLRLCA